MSPVGTSWQPWPAEDKDMLRKWHGEGLTGGQIRQKFARAGKSYSRNAVIGMWHRLKLARRGPSSNTGGHPKGKRPRIEFRAAPKVCEKPKHRGSTGGLASKVLHAIKHPPKLAPLPIDLGPPEALMITLMQLTEHTCKYPLGEATGGAQLFCGAVKSVEESWCPHHHRIVFQPTRAFMEKWFDRLAGQVAA